jgi:hypothetical protein
MASQFRSSTLDELLSIDRSLLSTGQKIAHTRALNRAKLASPIPEVGAWHWV